MAQLLQYYKRSFQQQPRQQISNLQPTFEDLSIDDKLSELQRLIRYSRSAIGLQRLVHVKMLAHIASNVGFAVTSASIFPLLDAISNDQESAVRQHLIEQLSPLAHLYCEEGGAGGYSSMITGILPLIAIALEDDKPEVRHAACSTLVSVSELLTQDDLGQHVLTIVLQLAHEDEREDRRMTAAELLNSLAERFGIDLCKQFVIPEVVSLAEDPVFRVRKSTALHFHNICKIGGEFELFERLMPAFVRLSKDEMYRVRRACADSIAEIAKYVSDDIRVGVLSEIYLRLVQDPSRLVKQSALLQSGMFISSLPSRAVNDSILQNFCSMAMSPSGDAAADAELRRHCAFGFPAVLQTIGAARWPEVRELYRALVQSRSCNVKQTLACSLHEVARILSTSEEVPEPLENFDENSNEFFLAGVSLVERELIPIFECMLQDEEVVQMGVMRHLAEFLSVLSVPCRVSYLPLLHDILHSTNLFNWRLRQCLAVQLPSLLLLPPRDLVFNTLFTLVMTLLQDPVASVRCESFLGVARMVMILSLEADSSTAELAMIDRRDVLEDGVVDDESNHIVLHSVQQQLAEEKGHQKKLFRQHHHNIAVTAAHHVDIVANALQTLIQGRSYRLRQLWVELSHSLLLEIPQELFEKHFLDGLLYLTSDPVSNVRIAVATVLAGWKDYRPPPAIPNPTPTDQNISLGCEEEVLLVESSPWKWLLGRSDIAQCVMRLSADHEDIYSVMVHLQPLFPHIVFRAVSCKGRKEAPGGKNPVPNMCAENFCQDSTCIASPASLSSQGGGVSENRSDDGDESDIVGTLTMDENEAATWEPSPFTFAAISSTEDPSAALSDAGSLLDRRIGRSVECRSNRSLVPLLIPIDAPPQDRDSPAHRDTPTYWGSPVNNYLSPADIIITSIASPARDTGPGYGVKSPSRKVEASAEVLQQQLEEIRQERSIHHELRHSASDGADGLVQSGVLSLRQPNLDAPICAELELSLSPAGKRRSPGASILERAVSHEDSDDEDNAELEKQKLYCTYPRSNLINGSFFTEETSTHFSESKNSLVHEFDRLRISGQTEDSESIFGSDSPPQQPSSSSLYSGGHQSTPSDVTPSIGSADATSKTGSSSVHIISNSVTVTPMCVKDNAQDSIHDETLIPAEALTHKST